MVKLMTYSIESVLKFNSGRSRMCSGKPLVLAVPQCTRCKTDAHHAAICKQYFLRGWRNRRETTTFGDIPYYRGIKRLTSVTVWKWRRNGGRHIERAKRRSKSLTWSFPNGSDQSREATANRYYFRYRSSSGSSTSLESRSEMFNQVFFESFFKAH